MTPRAPGRRKVAIVPGPLGRSGYGKIILLSLLASLSYEVSGIISAATFNNGLSGINISSILITYPPIFVGTVSATIVLRSLIIKLRGVATLLLIAVFQAVGVAIIIILFLLSLAAFSTPHGLRASGIIETGVLASILINLFPPWLIPVTTFVHFLAVRRWCAGKQPMTNPEEIAQTFS